METKRSYVRLYFLIFVLILFVVIYVLNKEEKEESIIESKQYSVNLLIEDELEFKEEDNNYYVNHNGDLTGYSADCPACNGTLACMPKYNVYKNNVVTYNDNTYGKVRIVATSKNVPCGSIIKFKSSTLSSEEVYAIVLDRGVLGYDVDLLVQSEAYASKYIGRSNITYDIVRSGW